MFACFSFILPLICQTSYLAEVLFAQLDQQIHHFKVATKIDPYYMYAHLNLGVAYSRKDMNVEAVEVCDMRAIYSLCSILCTAVVSERTQGVVHSTHDVRGPGPDLSESGHVTLRLGTQRGGDGCMQRMPQVCAVLQIPSLSLCSV